MSHNKIVSEFLQESNRIEGFNYPCEEYLKAFDQKSDIFLVENSIHAYKYVAENFEKDFDFTDLFELHKRQMTGFLTNNNVGLLRRGMVYVGDHVPPSPEVLHYYLDQFIQDFNNKKNKSLILHYQFEHIHPFLDGNGRVGRLIWAWHLLKNKKKLHNILDNYKEKKNIENVMDVIFEDFISLRSKYYNALRSYHSKVRHDL